MPTINFPTSPTLNQIYTFGNRSWKWNGEGWESYNASAQGGTSGGKLYFFGQL